MEKFGIFELLDALSAILSGENGPTDSPKPPAEAPAAPSKEPQGSAALSSFLARHDSVSKKIDGK